jgi:hypothetical protein
MRVWIDRQLMKWDLAIRVQPIVWLTVFIKAVFIVLDLQVWDMNPLLSGLIAANVFLLGFLISGVLIDYKEAERLPSDIAASITSIFDEVVSIYNDTNAPIARECIDHLSSMTATLKDWFYKKQHTDDLMDELSRLNRFLAGLDSSSGNGSMARIKAEQSAIRRTLIRVRTMRGTFFVPSGYAIAEATNVTVIAALWLTDITAPFESMFYVGLITFLTSYILVLIRRLDNPFDYYSKESGVDEVSLMPLDEVQRWIDDFKAQIK